MPFVGRDSDQENRQVKRLKRRAEGSEVMNASMWRCVMRGNTFLEEARNGEWSTIITQSQARVAMVQVE